MNWYISKERIENNHPPRKHQKDIEIFSRKSLFLAKENVIYQFQHTLIYILLHLDKKAILELSTTPYVNSGNVKLESFIKGKLS